ncbi:siderophore-interacting protein [Agrococcus sp. Marseille-Q4369]|uniref:siderophore-interacting protein n=1 Tax=Agrococcus sp. Marseille-Q4369 TaxID=2810513 RepID=UPI001B8D799A|nr:siderophore-interacting protein [Agrococcus sp. Marseille-Q4369]QUW19027.1 siderophore-interacting protein [Agrococcus sp. Marseille-Q4369]
MSAPVRPPRPNRPQHVMEVVRVERIAPSMVRIWIGGDGYATFAPNAFTDAYVKIWFAKPELGLEPPYDVAALRESLAPDDLPVTRTYTVRAIADDSFAIDVVVHGDQGLAGPWAARVQPGERVVFGGPGGAFAPDETAAWHLFLGDESSLPAIARSVESLPATARGAALIEVRDGSEELPFSAPDGFEVRWLHRGEASADTVGLLADQTAALELPEGRGQVFAHGERESMKALRDELLVRRGLERSQVSLSGYWALGRTEDRFQAEKREPIGQILPPAHAAS